MGVVKRYPECALRGTSECPLNAEPTQWVAAVCMRELAIVGVRDEWDCPAPDYEHFDSSPQAFNDPTSPVPIDEYGFVKLRGDS